MKIGTCSIRMLAGLIALCLSATTLEGVALINAGRDATLAGPACGSEWIGRGERGLYRNLPARLPVEIAAIDEPELRKRHFLAVLLPIAHQVSERIECDRAHLSELARQQELGLPLDAAARRWLDDLGRDYGVEDDMAELLRRVDTVPISLLLAQAALESGWGTSRLAQQGNALFGQIAGRGRQPRYATFATLTESVQAYVRNLNTHAAYKDFREQRAALRDAREPQQGHKLAAKLTRYSTRGSHYTRHVQQIIATNALGRFDRQDQFTS